MKLFTQLTNREEEVLTLLAKGHNNTMIAADIHTSVFTVQNHVCNILQKLAVKNRTAATAHYWQRLSREDKKDS